MTVCLSLFKSLFDLFSFFLIQFLGGETDLGDGDFFILREAVEKLVFAADTYHIAELVPEIVGIYAVRGERRLFVVYNAAAALKREAVTVMGKSALSDLVDTFHIGHYADVDGDIEFIFAFFYLFSNLFPFPFIPVGDMGENGIGGRQFARRLHRPFGAAGGAGEFFAFAFHTRFAFAVRAFIQHAVQTVAAKRHLASSGHIAFVRTYRIRRIYRFLCDMFAFANTFLYSHIGISYSALPFSTYSPL